MTRYNFLRFLFLISLLATAIAIALRIWQNPGAPSKDGFAGLAPLFLTMFAMRAERFPKAGLFLGLLGFAACMLNLVMVWRSAFVG